MPVSKGKFPTHQCRRVSVTVLISESPKCTHVLVKSTSKAGKIDCKEKLVGGSHVSGGSIHAILLSNIFKEKSGNLVACSVNESAFNCKWLSWLAEKHVTHQCFTAALAS